MKTRFGPKHACPKRSTRLCRHPWVITGSERKFCKHSFLVDYATAPSSRTRTLLAFACRTADKRFYCRTRLAGSCSCKQGLDNANHLAAYRRPLHWSGPASAFRTLGNASCSRRRRSPKSSCKLGPHNASHQVVWKASLRLFAPVLL